MRVNIKGLVNRLDSLRERINDLFDNLDCLEELEQGDIEIETVQQYLRNDDTFNLSIALGILEQVDKLDKALDIIKEKQVDMSTLLHSFKPDKMTLNAILEVCESFDGLGYYNVNCYQYDNKARDLTQEEYDLLMEVLL